MSGEIGFSTPERRGLYTIESNRTVNGDHQVILRKGGETVAILHGKSQPHLMEEADRIIQYDTAVPLYSGL